MLDNYIVLSSISPSSYHYSFGVGVGGVVPGWCDMIVLFLQNHASAWPFQRPVEMTEAPDYYDHIKYPMGELLFFLLLSFSAFSSIGNKIQICLKRLGERNKRVKRGREKGTNELKEKGTKGGEEDRGREKRRTTKQPNEGMEWRWGEGRKDEN